MDWGLALKILVTVLGFFLAAIEFNILFKSAKEKVRKRAIVGIFLALILFTVWDTTSDYVGNKREERKRDSLITVDSLRSAKIIGNINANLVKLGEVSSQVVDAYSEIVGVKRGIENQKIILEDISVKSDFSTKTSKELSDLDSPLIKILDENTTSSFDSDGNLVIKIAFKNFGVRTATNVRLFYQLIHAKSVDNSPRNHIPRIVGKKGDTIGYFPKAWQSPENNHTFLPSGEKSKGTLTIESALKRDDFSQKYDLWTVIISVDYDDVNGKNNKKATFSVTGSNYTDGKFEIHYNYLNLPAMNNFFIKNDIDQFIFDY